MSYNPQNPNGQATSANSAPVVIASDQPALQARITDGVQSANTVAGDTGQNSLVTAGSRKEVAFSTTTVQAVAVTDVSNYRWVSVHIVTQGTSSTVMFQSSNDGTNWLPQTLSLSSSSATIATNSAGASVLYVGPLAGRYFRLNVTGISAGTTAGVVEFFSLAQSVMSSNAVQGGTWTVMPGNTANTTPWLMTPHSGTAAAAFSDDNSNNVAPSATSNKQVVVNRNMLWFNNNGTWERSRQIENGLNSNGTGIAAVGMVGQFDDTSPTTLTENLFGPVRLSANRNLYGTIRDAAGNERGANVTAANALVVDGSAVTQPVSMGTRTSGGPTVVRIMSAATTNATSSKTSAGQLYSWFLANNAVYDVFIKFYNKASAPTVGTDTPLFTIKIPAGGASNIEFSLGVPFGTGIAYAITRQVTDSDTTAVALNDLTGFFTYA